MRRFLLSFIILLVTFGMLIHDADARRFGGGKSFGAQRSASSFSRTNNNTNTPFTKPANKWLGPLAGLAVGGLLASLFMGHGFASGMLSWLLIAGVAFMLWGFIRNRFQPAAQAARYNHQFTENANNVNYGFNNQNTISNFPVGFDQTEFLRNAKAQFIRLQAAYDNKNMADIREFTTPEVFAEIQLQLQERGDAANYTEVVSLEAELLDAENEMATVRFSGMIKEEQNSPANSFQEVWHFKKNPMESRWFVAGVQQ
jgi:predicted lipid-binding transport protein (Tim44 family)